MKKLQAAALLSITALLVSGCVASAVGKDDTQATRASAPPARPAGEAPRLVVMLVVDQLRGDYLDRLEPRLTGGLGRIRRESVYFKNGRQAHALLETAAGHATLSSGRFPTHTNIISNDRGVGDPGSPLIGSDRAGASPARFVGTTFYDWLRAADPESIAVSVSRKDRGAILLVGRAQADVAWFGGEHGFTSSRWYGGALPAWVSAWNDRFDIRRFAGREWALSRPDSAYDRPDDQPWENGGREVTFPHRLTAVTAQLPTALESVPWMDSLTLNLALAGVHARALGQRGHTDYLGVSLSTTDAVGHSYGPDSREVVDQILRLDGWLGAFLDSLALVVPPERMVVALSADHGVSAYPQRTVAQGGKAGLIDLGPLIDSLADDWRLRWGTTFGVSQDNGLIYADAPALIARGVRLDSLARSVAARIGRPGVASVITRETLAAAPDSDRASAMWRRSLPADGTWLAAGVAEPGWIFSGNARQAQHGTLSTDDQWVPIAFLVPGVAARTVERPLETIDVAPTLAWLAGVAPTEPVDGRPASEVTDAVVAQAPAAGRPSP